MPLSDIPDPVTRALCRRVQTRLQKMQPLPDGSLPYRGLADCLVKTVRTEGVGKLYTGFPTFCVRIAPHATLTLILLVSAAHDCKDEWVNNWLVWTDQIP